MTRPSSIITRPVPQPSPADRKSQLRDDFAALVAKNLDGPVLRYSCRTRLIRHGMAMGIGRFECNLVIAMEEHRAAKAPVREKPAPPRRALPFLTFAAVQSAIVAGAWWLLH